LDVDKTEKDAIKDILKIFDIYNFKVKMSWGVKYGSLGAV
jgi:hypothetical protein